MTRREYDVDEVAAQLGAADVVWLSAQDALGVARWPSEWSEIASATEPLDRIALARARWPADLTTRLPRFDRLLTEQLIDVTPATIGDDVALVYVTHDGDDLLPWAGTAPYAGEPALPLRPGVPQEISHFQTHVHAGFGLDGGDVCGILRPSYQVSRAEFVGLTLEEGHSEDLIAGEYHGQSVHWDELFLLSYDSSQAFYFSSPLFAPDEIAFVYYNDFEIHELWSSLDDFMVTPYKNIVY